MNPLTIDHRPALTTLLGTLLLLGSLFLGWRSFAPGAERLYQAVQAKGGAPQGPARYAYKCARIERCRAAYWRAWPAGADERTLLVSGLTLGALLAAGGSFWKPEVTRTRAWRHHGQQQVNLPPKLAVVARGEASSIPWPPQRSHGVDV